MSPSPMNINKKNNKNKNTASPMNINKKNNKNKNTASPMNINRPLPLPRLQTRPTRSKPNSETDLIIKVKLP